MSEVYDRYGWQSDLDVFSKSEAHAVRLRLQDFVTDASPEQVKAWDQCIPWLQRECRELTARDATALKYSAILEYELPRDSRRPDVIVLERGCFIVLEIKGYIYASQAAIDQAFSYARDLAAYHAACAGYPVIPVLLTREAGRKTTIRDGVYVTSPEHLDALLEELSKPGLPIVSIDDFLRTDAYAPLPSIVQAARELFNKRPLPFIKRARASTEPALKYITEVAHRAAATKSRHLVLLNGVPGSGKTLVGLQLVHAGWLDDLSVDRGEGKPPASAVYLSGNGPLVQVLQHALREGGGGGRIFVQDIKKYVEYYSRRASPPPEHLIVFDEAQRAHDAERVSQVHDEPVGQSEPDHLLEFCDRIPQWSVLVALIGEGQAIHVGEEGGIGLWADALAGLPNPQRWTVHASERFASYFSDVEANSEWNEALNLDTEIRFHLTPKVHQFVAALLDSVAGHEMRELAAQLHTGGHRFLITRELDKAKQYLRERYEDAANARYGVLASSKDKWLPEFGVDNTFQTTKRLRVGPWYNSEIDDPESCCNLTTVATEFSSQGLELDCALVAWGSDLLWDGVWSIAHSRGTRGMVADPLALRRNVYRVLLTRGRDGSVVYVPEDSRFNETYAHLLDVGMKPFE